MRGASFHYEDHNDELNEQIIVFISCSMIIKYTYNFKMLKYLNTMYK